MYFIDENSVVFVIWNFFLRRITRSVLYTRIGVPKIVSCSTVVARLPVGGNK